MRQINREVFMTSLVNDWGSYLDRYQTLPPAGQRAFLERQGYATLGGLLGHIIAWWQDGARVIAEMRAVPSMPNLDYDVDSFNARAVERFGLLSDNEASRLFLNQRQFMVDLVISLPDDQLLQDNINTRLYYEILQHWKEHEIL